MKRFITISLLLALLLPSLFLNIILLSNINGIIVHSKELLEKTQDINYQVDCINEQLDIANNIIYETQKKDMQTVVINGNLYEVISEDREKGFKYLCDYTDKQIDRIR